MLFSSYLFIFIFLPITLFLFWSTARKISQQTALGVLLFASLIFYGWSDFSFVLILLFSISVNFFIGKYIRVSDIKIRKRLLFLGVVFNLSLLMYYKYTNFFIQNINVIFQADLPILNIILPLGISFFTFTQLAFLVDSYRGLVEKYHFINYALFVTYFPHLIAGPIIHHKDVMPQFENKKIFQFNYLNFVLGLTLFAFGLFKKTVIADSLGAIVIRLFDMHLQEYTTIDAWIAALGYTFELYFDFSGYSDMAMGLSLLIGVKLPVNFYSPYKALNIIDFWRRWNMTLSRFLRDYLYISLGGNRNGPVRRYLNLMITMLLGGLWHGAGWTFILWGFLHGFYLCINHGWIYVKKYLGVSLPFQNISNIIAGFITFLAVVIAWVVFRAPDLATATQILHAMFVPNIHTFSAKPLWVSMNKSILLLFASAMIVWFLPNTYQLLRKYKPALLAYQAFYTSRPNRLVWKPTLVWSVMMGLILSLSILHIQTSNIFLYFRF